MHVLIFGKTGQVARELCNVNWPASWRLTIAGRSECDLLLAGSAARAITAFKPDLVINAAAYTAVDRAETDQDAAFTLNASAPAEMAAATVAIGVPLLHISTDYVFDGNAARPYHETDACAPLSVYGKSKLAGETAVRESQPRHMILRTSWVFSSHGANFVRTMLRLGAERDELAIVGDQIGGPTSAADIAQTLARIADAGAPFISWHRFAEEILARAAFLGLKVPSVVRRIMAAEYPSAAPRPANSRLDCAMIARDWGIQQPSWETALDRCLEVLISRSGT